MRSSTLAHYRIVFADYPSWLQRAVMLTRIFAYRQVGRGKLTVRTCDRKEKAHGVSVIDDLDQRIVLSIQNSIGRIIYPYNSVDRDANRQNKMISPYLEAERERLLQLIQAIRDSGTVAPINVWISPAPKGEHLYYKLSSKNPDYKNQHLGKAGSEKYRNWKARIQRRETITELEQQLAMLQALLDRPSITSSEVPDGTETEG